MYNVSGVSASGLVESAALDAVFFSTMRRVLPHEGA